MSAQEFTPEMAARCLESARAARSETEGHCGHCGREACKAALQVKAWGIADEAALLDCERAKSARLAGELSDAKFLGAAHFLAMEDAVKRADKAERALATALYVVEAGNRWAADGTNSQRRVDLREALFAYKIAAKGVVAATAPAEVARVTFRGVVSRVGKGEIEVKWTEGEMECSAWLPGWPGATIGDAVAVTVRKG